MSGFLVSFAKSHDWTFLIMLQYIYQCCRIHPFSTFKALAILMDEASDIQSRKLQYTIASYIAISSPIFRTLCLQFLEISPCKCCLQAYCLCHTIYMHSAINICYNGHVLTPIIKQISFKPQSITKCHCHPLFCLTYNYIRPYKINTLFLVNVEF